MGIILNYSNAVRSNLVTTVGAFYVGNENDLYPAPAAKQAGAFPSIVANASQTPQFTFNANNSAPNALTTFGNLPFGISLLHGKGLSVANNWIYPQGRHTWNFGAEFRHSTQHLLGENCICTGVLNFSNNTTSNNDPNINDALNIKHYGNRETNDENLSR